MQDLVRQYRETSESLTRRIDDIEAELHTVIPGSSEQVKLVQRRAYLELLRGEVFQDIQEMEDRSHAHEAAAAL